MTSRVSRLVTVGAPFVLLLLLLLLLPGGVAEAAGPSPAALQSWDRYVARLEQARAADRTHAVATWATDDDPAGAAIRAAVLRGGIVVSRRALPVAGAADATLQHWQGSILLRGLSLAHVAERLRHPERFAPPPDVVTLDVSNRNDAGHELYLRLTRSMLVSATYDTWHRVRHHPRSPTRLDSDSLATRIQEVQDPGGPHERLRSPDEGRGFLWRMHSYWRFSVVPDGVVATCESITLSRPVPTGLGLVSRPVIARVARESMATALQAWQRPLATVRSSSR